MEDVPLGAVFEAVAVALDAFMPPYGPPRLFMMCHADKVPSEAEDHRIGIGVVEMVRMRNFPQTATLISTPTVSRPEHSCTFSFFAYPLASSLRSHTPITAYSSYQYYVVIIQKRARSLITRIWDPRPNPWHHPS